MKWQYKIVKVAVGTTLAQIENALNNQGALGWELIGVVLQGTDYVVYLKRLIAS
ncbi:MAG TPA: DUF4177 domain-containing protein [Candidatus Brocadiaceae bacterium]|nr:DUF4177 domain-containing protein [Candidatus Brocadiaceae bacterium]